jgi:hypothetical protein
VKGFLAGWGIRILIIGAIALGAFIFRDRLSGSAGDLAVGDCFQVPAESVEIEDVQHSPCNEAHTGEVFYAADYAGGGDSYPIDTQFDDAVGAQCLPAFNSYTGRDYQSDTELDIGYFYPTMEGWNDGDHEIVCYAVRIDSATMLSSVKVAP